MPTSPAQSMSVRDDTPRYQLHGPLATPDAIAHEPAPFPKTTTEAPLESVFADWEKRLTGNLSRRSDGRWEPLTWTHADAPQPVTGEAVATVDSAVAAEAESKL